jgi:hypothetical protein
VRCGWRGKKFDFLNESASNESSDLARLFKTPLGTGYETIFIRTLTGAATKRRLSSLALRWQVAPEDIHQEFESNWLGEEIIHPGGKT